MYVCTRELFFLTRLQIEWRARLVLPVPQFKTNWSGPKEDPLDRLTSLESESTVTYW